MYNNANHNPPDQLVGPVTASRIAIRLPFDEACIEPVEMLRAGSSESLSADLSSFTVKRHKYMTGRHLQLPKPLPNPKCWRLAVTDSYSEPIGTTIFKPFMILGLAFCATACTTSMEADAKKMAELQCEAIQLTMGGALDALEGKTDIDQIQAHQKKVEKFQLKMMKKYDSPEEKMEFHSKVMEASLIKCM